MGGGLVERKRIVSPAVFCVDGIPPWRDQMLVGDDPGGNAASICTTAPQWPLPQLIKTAPADPWPSVMQSREAVNDVREGTFPRGVSMW